MIKLVDQHLVTGRRAHIKMHEGVDQRAQLIGGRGVHGRDARGRVAQCLDMGVHRLEQDVFLRGEVMIDQRLRCLTGGGKVGHGCTEEPLFRIEVQRAFNNEFAPIVEICRLRPRHGM